MGLNHRTLTSANTNIAQVEPNEDRSDIGDVPLSTWERWTFELTRAVVFCLAKVLSLSGLYALCHSFGTMEWLIDFKRRARVNEQVRQILGDRAGPRQIRAATKRQFIRMRCDKTFFLIFDMFDTPRLLQQFSITPPDIIDDALKQGRGVYLVLSHLGHQHLAFQFLRIQGYKMVAVREAKMGAVWRYTRNKREQKGLPVIEYFYTDTFPRNIYRKFEDNYIVGSLIDAQPRHSVHRRSAEVVLFGKPRRLLTGPLHIALKSGAPIVQAFAISRPGFRYAIELLGPLNDPSDERPSNEIVSDAVQRYAKNLETFARRHPCHVSRF